MIQYVRVNDEYLLKILILNTPGYVNRIYISERRPEIGHSEVGSSLSK